jgi:hypothetical protein
MQACEFTTNAQICESFGVLSVFFHLCLNNKKQAAAAGINISGWNVRCFPEPVNIDRHSAPIQLRLMD